MPSSRRASDALVDALAPVMPVRDAVLFPGQIHTLHVAREGSKRAGRQAISESKLLFVVSQRDQAVEDPATGDLYRIGTLCEPLQTVPLPDGSIRVALRCLHRAEAKRYNRRSGVISAAYHVLPEGESSGIEEEALMRMCIEAFSAILAGDSKIPPEAMDSVIHQESAGALADAIAHHLPLRPSQKQELLEQIDPSLRIRAVYDLLRKEERLFKIQREISDKVDRDFASTQREFYLREQLRTVQSELEAMGESASDLKELREAIERAELPQVAKDKAHRELARLDTASMHSPETTVIRNYLDWMSALPWSRLSPDRLDIQFAREALDEAHYGLRQVKERILDYLAVRQLTRSLRGPILCFVGPPGVGKTSVGRSIADALGREFVRISLGGLRDEAEIRGHRRTYVGAQPGRILQSLRQCGTRNPVMVLDEIDKLSSDFRGDPSSALLEALDPAQNDRFSDHFLETPFDLSGVLFIATANLVEDIPHALRDRMEIVSFRSYTDEERLQIGRGFVVPRQLAAHGLSEDQLRLAPSALATLVQHYAKEAGVRELERVVGAICRKAARKIAEGKSARIRVTSRSLERLVGPPRHVTVSRMAHGEIGAANSMVVTEYGGEVIPIEVLLLEASKGGPTLRLTGNLGSIMRESAEAALSYIRSKKGSLGPGLSLDRDVHVHVPDNAVPKEGPSAGLTIAVALASAVSGRSVRDRLAMTGEVTLRGKVLAVGGIREKVIAASREGLQLVLLPKDNRSDLSDVPRSALAKLRIEFVSTIEDALKLSLEPAESSSAVVEAAQVEAPSPALHRR